MNSQQPLLPWMLSFLKPHRGRVSLLSVLLLLAMVFFVWIPYRRSILGRAAYAIGSSEHAAFMSGANDGVSLPVAKAAFAGNDLWTFINAGSVRDLAPADVAAITLALLLLAA